MCSELFILFTDGIKYCVNTIRGCGRARNSATQNTETQKSDTGTPQSRKTPIPADAPHRRAIRADRPVRR